MLIGLSFDGVRLCGLGWKEAKCLSFFIVAVIPVSLGTGGLLGLSRGRAALAPGLGPAAGRRGTKLGKLRLLGSLLSRPVLLVTEGSKSNQNKGKKLPEPVLRSLQSRSAAWAQRAHAATGA